MLGAIPNLAINTLNKLGHAPPSPSVGFLICKARQLGQDDLIKSIMKIYDFMILPEMLIH